MSVSVFQRVGNREVLNVLTSFVDGSNIYESEPEKARELRVQADGILKGE